MAKTPSRKPEFTGKEYIKFMTAEHDETTLDPTKIVAFQEAEKRQVKILCEGGHVFTVTEDEDDDIQEKLQHVFGSLRFY